MSEVKKCCTCKEVFTLDNFYKSNNSCKKCISVRNKKDRLKKKNPKEKEIIPDGMKRCLGCKDLKTLDNYYYNKRNDKHNARCKPCVADYHKYYVSDTKIEEISKKNRFILTRYLNTRIKMDNGDYIYLEDISKENVIRLIREGYYFVLKKDYNKYM